MNTTMDTLTIDFIEQKQAIEKCFKYVHTKSDGSKDAQWVGDGIPPTLINTIPDFNAFFDLVSSRITPDLDFDKPHLAYNFHLGRHTQCPFLLALTPLVAWDFTTRILTRLIAHWIIC